MNVQSNCCLKQFFYEGLIPDLKVAASFRFEMGTDYNKFKSDVRAFEVDLQRSKENEGKTKCNVATKKEEESETKQTLNKVLTMM